MNLQGCLKFAASLGLLVLGGGAVQAQSNGSPAVVGSVEGTVFDSLLVKGPLRGATVYVIGATLTTTTDSRGKFTIDNVPDGDHVLTFAHPGAGAVRSEHRVRRRRFLDEALTTSRRPF